MNVLGTWTSKGLPRPSWSNSRGDVRMILEFNLNCLVISFEILLWVTSVLINFVNFIIERFRQARFGVKPEM